MTKYRVRYSWHAVDDLDSIFDYISDENRAAAVRLLERLEDAMLRLAHNPRLGAVLQTSDLSLVKPGYRRLVVAPYLIFYRIGDGEIFVARVLHSRQDWLHLILNRHFET